jgi:hypothetical protein
MVTGAERLVLDLLKGREKLNDGRGRWPVVFDVSELKDGDRGCERGLADIGEYGSDMALLDDSLRGFENVDPAFELLLSSSELSG